MAEKKKRVQIIPPIHGKVTRDGKVSEPDIYWIMEKWLDRHPQVNHEEHSIRVTRGNGPRMTVSRPRYSWHRLSMETPSLVMPQKMMSPCTSTI